MLKIKCIRGLGDKQGADIYDPLLNTVGALTARGRHEINLQDSSRKRVSVSGAFPELYSPGTFVAIDGDVAGKKGVVVQSSIHVSIGIDTLAVDQTCEVECLNE